MRKAGAPPQTPPRHHFTPVLKSWIRPLLGQTQGPYPCVRILLNGRGSTFKVFSLGTRPYMRIWVWWRPIEGFVHVPEECNYPAVRRLLINVIFSLQLIVGVPTCICIRLRLRVGILQSQWSLGRSVVDEINTVVQKTHRFPSACW